MANAERKFEGKAFSWSTFNNPDYISTRVVVEAGTSETETETWVAETKTETEAI